MDISAKLILEIKKKRELKSISSDFIKTQVESYLKKHKFTERISEKDFRLIVKSIRSELRLYTGRFQSSVKDRISLLDSNDYRHLLETNSAAKERAEDYEFLKQKISELNAVSILDLGCGINPIALANKNIKYYASDIRDDDLNLLKAFFDKNKINGKVFYYDLNNIKREELPSADLCLLMKVLDILDKKDKSLSERIILSVPSRYILVSFAARTLSGRNMNHPRRIWFERILQRNSLQFEYYQRKNEIYYLIKKQ